jgi:hypothetical protein
MKIDVEKQWDELMGYVETWVGPDRRDAVEIMYEELSDKVCTAPASGNSNYHNCFPGGYIDHVNRVVRSALMLYDIWTTNGAIVGEYSKAELVFAAINHDLGKVGTETEDYYIPNDSKWHVERGQVYKINTNLTFMKVPDRSLYMLQRFGIPVSESEYLAIKLHDGMYAKGNESYLMTNSEMSLKNNMPILLHHADHMASQIEEANRHKGYTNNTGADTSTKIKSKMTNVNNPVQDDALKAAFDSIFN